MQALLNVASETLGCTALRKLEIAARVAEDVLVMFATFSERCHAEEMWKSLMVALSINGQPLESFDDA